MRIQDRDIKAIAGAVFHKKHYIALANMVKVYPDFPAAFARYMSNAGSYPYNIRVRTPLGMISPKLYSYHDLLTVTEIFCRNDYRAGSGTKVVVDIGSNIGISALYFLTRSKDTYCYLFEPVPSNIEKMQKNLKDFEGRYRLRASAVADRSGTLDFGIEETGRYGGLRAGTGNIIQVQCLNVNDVLDEVLGRESRIDILKLDTEGDEEDTIRCIHEEHLKRIGTILFEGKGGSIGRITPGSEIR